MKKFLLLLLLPAALYCNGKPKIEFDALTHDFGEQSQNAELKHTFIIRNAGDGTLLIDKIRAG
ncbi:MAG: DUF1573 domain-containing protein [Spirochaetes bacterium]|nr:DUF1573 domain-containing protein [Spirochaetota bacterium]